MNLKAGIDLGGSKIELIVLDESGGERLRKRLATPQGDYRATLLAIKSLVDCGEAECGVFQTLGIGTPGALSKATGLLKNSNSVCLNAKPLLQDLQVLLDRPIKIANDADCFALSEAVDGAALGAHLVFGVILGTGVGAGIVANGAILSGANGITGEWGHNPMPWPTDIERLEPLCYCGKIGCIETYLSGPGLSRSHLMATGQNLNASQIVEGALAYDEACQSSMELYEDRLARGLSHVINILDPDVIVLGGGLSNCARLYKNIPKLWGAYVFSDRVDTRLVAPVYGDSSGVRGAAWL